MDVTLPTIMISRPPPSSTSLPDGGPSQSNGERPAADTPPPPQRRPVPGDAPRDSRHGALPGSTDQGPLTGLDVHEIDSETVFDRLFGPDSK